MSHNNSQNNGQHPQHPQQENQENDWFTVAAAGVAGALLAGGAAYYLTSGSSSDRQTNSTPARVGQIEHSSRPTMEQSGSGWLTTMQSWLDPGQLFRQKVELQQNEEVTIINESLPESGRVKPEKFQHPYNKFDTWFENLNRQSIKIRNDTKTFYKEALLELTDKLFPAMKTEDSLFNFLYRDLRPAGSAWEDLRICAPDEYDVNVILFPPDVQDGLEVVDLKSGHIGLNLNPNGFIVKRNHVAQKFPNNSEVVYQSIQRKLDTWLDYEKNIKRSKVLDWMKGVVASALNKQLKDVAWKHLEKITPSTSGPAITLNVVMKNGKTFSVDLVPALEFSTAHLPTKTQNKVKNISKIRTWYAIPKGSTGSPPNEWRTSLYETERDLIKGKYHLKPSIRIIKRLRDEQNWKGLSSYYIKTTFLWMWQDSMDRWGLGRIIMHALVELEKNLRENRIKYYWDDGLNLLDNVDNPELFTNIANRLRTIRRKFERSLEDDSVDPMEYFGCRKSGCYMPAPGAQISFSPEAVEEIQSPNENCSLM